MQSFSDLIQKARGLHFILYFLPWKSPIPFLLKPISILNSNMKRPSIKDTKLSIPITNHSNWPAITFPQCPKNLQHAWCVSFYNFNQKTVIQIPWKISIFLLLLNSFLNSASALVEKKQQWKRRFYCIKDRRWPLMTALTRHKREIQSSKYL